MPEPKASLQVVPSGLLGFLQLKNGGKFPTSLDEALLPTLELLEWYMMTNNEALNANALLIAGPSGSQQAGFVGLVVPDNELWYVSDATAQFTFLAGQTANTISLGTSRSNLAAFYSPKTSASAAGVPAGGGTLSISCSKFFMRPADQLTMGLLNLVGAGNLSVLGSCLIARLPF